MPVRGQKEDTEEEKVGGTSVLNKQNIYTAGRSVCLKESGESRHFSFVPPTGRM